MIYLLSQILFGSISPQLNQLFVKKYYIIALKEITKLLELVIEQEKKYEDKLLLHCNYYCRHLIV